MQQKDVFDYITFAIAVLGIILAVFTFLRDIRNDRRGIRLLIDLPLHGKNERGVETALSSGYLIITNSSKRPITIRDAVVSLRSPGEGKERWTQSFHSGYFHGALELPTDSIADGSTLSLPIDRCWEHIASKERLTMAALVRDSEGRTYRTFEKGNHWEKARNVSGYKSRWRLL